MKIFITPGIVNFMAISLYLVMPLGRGKGFPQLTRTIHCSNIEVVGLSSQQGKKKKKIVFIYFVA